ncbi:MAG TPA: class I SAM-dependent methyltransferase, partial [Candidatus Omnitrophica bacterium]|nr:class I SAM-dependent methyltransferase [Candidatus Omnitrophota bacterium]
MNAREEKKWSDYGKSRLISRNRLLFPHHRIVTQYFLDFFKDLDVNLKILDIGCGDGFFMELLRDLGFKNIKGIDISVSMLEKAKEKGLDVEKKDIYDIDDKEKYSVVLVMDVLEHLEKPEEALKKIYNILNPQGFLYMNIPICDSLSLRLWRLLSGQTRAELVRGCDET